MKKYLMILLIFTFSLFITPSIVKATETTNKHCNLNIVITEPTRTYEGTDFKVIFKMLNSTEEYQLEIRKDSTWGIGEMAVLQIPADKTYELTFEGLLEGYTIYDILTGEKVESIFLSKEGLQVLNWTITNESEMVSDTVIEEPPVQTRNDTDNNYSDKEAKEVYDTFVETVSFIADDPTWSSGISSLLNQYGEESINAELYSGWFETYVEGGTAEAYFAMSSFDQFLWTETYTKLAYEISGSGNYDNYFKDEKTFHDRVTDNVIHMMRGDNAEVVKEAYLALMDWQYAYIIENGTPYCFITGRDFFEEVEDGYWKENPDIEQEVPEGEMPVEEVEEGNWDGVFNTLAKNGISILLLGVLGIALAVIVHKKKMKNVEDELD